MARERIIEFASNRDHIVRNVFVCKPSMGRSPHFRLEYEERIEDYNGRAYDSERKTFDTSKDGVRNPNNLAQLLIPRVDAAHPGT
ncbi:hypothetical protein DC522_28370 [Microvirga sp. KLBC 81]|nr:hypothetical protein DC522_28370 [Microvirga sp. KLBC 81]